jgi:hypothetical protein
MRVRDLKKMLENCYNENAEVMFLYENVRMSKDVKRLEVSTVFDGDLCLSLGETTEWSSEDCVEIIFVVK